TTVSILGCGWLALSLARKLIEKGLIVKGSTTTSEKIDTLRENGIKAYKIDIAVEIKDDSLDFFNCDVLFVCIPPKRKSGEAGLYPQKIASICRLATGHVNHLVLISSTGVYPNSGGEFNEFDLPVPDSESGLALLDAENIAKANSAFTTTIIRFGGLFGKDRNPGRFFSGRKEIPNGLAPVNMIHLNDCLGIGLAILEKQAFGEIYNACSPEHPTRMDVYTEAARRTNLPVPEFCPEQLDWKIINSVNVPLNLNYKFKESLL